MNPKKEAGNALNATTTVYAINQMKIGERHEMTEEKIIENARFVEKKSVTRIVKATMVCAGSAGTTS